MNEVEFASLLRSDPSQISKLKIKFKWEDFKRTNKLVKSSCLRCPVCSQPGESGSNLWISDFPNKYACRKCLNIFSIESTTISLKDLIKKFEECK